MFSNLVNILGGLLTTSGSMSLMFSLADLMTKVKSIFDLCLELNKKKIETYSVPHCAALKIL